MSKTLLGKGMHVSKGNGHLIIKLDTETHIGQDVADKDANPMGKIFDVFGPISAPYASIKLIEGYPLGKASGKPIFLREKPKKPYDKRKRRRYRKKRSR
jgi:rRNA processing protein Gar1